MRLAPDQFPWPIFVREGFIAAIGVVAGADVKFAGRIPENIGPKTNSAGRTRTPIYRDAVG
jgi:hypothetical protein